MKNTALRGIELFCGTKSFTKEAEKRGIKMLTLDNDRRFNPDILGNMQKFYLRGCYFDILWASPPCQCFSVASISTHWTGGFRAYEPKTIECRDALKMLENTIQLVDVLKPRFWFIENPRGVMRKIIDKMLSLHCVTDYERKTVTYCQYGDERMKPTDIWTNLHTWEPKPMCKNGDSCHVEARRGAKTGTQGRSGSIDRSRIPEALCEEIVEATLHAK